MERDFERVWLEKFSAGIARIAGAEVQGQVMQGSEELSSQSGRQEVIDWTKGAVERLESLASAEQCREIMTGCACQYPTASLQEMRRKYEETGDIDSVRQMLQQQFVSFLKGTLGLGEELIGEIVDRGWGLAGIKRGNTMIATKIPKSGYLVEYMEETDPAKKRQLYCHCPRIRDMLGTSETMSSTYCYCGAGFYKGMWEEILQKPVEVELLQSVLKGDEVCSFAIRLP